MALNIFTLSFEIRSSVCADYNKNSTEGGGEVIKLSVFMELIVIHYFSFCFLDGERNWLLLLPKTSVTEL